MRNPIEYAKYIVNRMKRRKVRKDEEQGYIRYVCEQTGWTPKHAKEEMDKAKEEDISYKYYVKRRAWARTDKEMEKMKRDMKYVSERNKEDHAHAVEVVCEATGWSESKARSEMIKAGRNCGCSLLNDPPKMVHRSTIPSTC